MKTIEATLLAHKGQPSTTLTDLLLIGPLADSTYRGLTTLDQDVTFTPSVSIGAITFYAHTGVQMSALQSGNDLGVNNAEAQTLLPVATFEVEGITQQQIDSGALDKVRFVVLRVNYNDLTTGRSEVVAGGTLGEIRQKNGGLTIMELRSLTQLLKQLNLIQLTSLGCRARFGSQPIGTGGGAIEEEFPCGFDVSGEWVSGTVESVGGDTYRQFIDATNLVDSGFDADYFAPGMVEFLTGDNAGQQVEVDAYDYTSGVVTLRFETVSPITVGDTFKIRRHCSKRWTGHNSCDTFWGADKTLHFRGEPWIPVGQASRLTVPGAGVSTSGTNTVGNTNAA